MPLPISCSLDSFFAAAAIALAGCPAMYRRRVTIGFAVCDGLAGVAGRLLHIPMPAFAVLVAFGLAALVLIPARRWPWFYLLIPVLLSADNLALGMSDLPASLASLMFQGIGSGVLAWAGFVFASNLTRIGENWYASGCDPLLR